MRAIRLVLSVSLGFAIYQPAFGSFRKPILLCKGKLESSTQNQELENEYQRIVSELKKPNGRSQARRLELLREFTQNPLLVNAAKGHEWRAGDLLSALTENKGDIVFFNRVAPLLASIDADMARRELDKLRRGVPPAELSNASAFPREVFSSDQQTDAGRLVLEQFVGDSATLSSRDLTRKIFAFMGANPDLSQAEKVNFCKNLMTVVHAKQQKADPNADLIVFDSFQSKKGDGAHIFCGHGCTFFFVVDKKGSFYSGRSYKSMFEDSTPDIIEDWQDYAQFIYKAGKETPEKEANF